jgi:hypothetical protein
MAFFMISVPIYMTGRGSSFHFFSKSQVNFRIMRRASGKRNRATIHLASARQLLHHPTHSETWNHSTRPLSNLEHPHPQQTNFGQKNANWRTRVLHPSPTTSRLCLTALQLRLKCYYYSSAATRSSSEQVLQGRLRWTRIPAGGRRNDWSCGMLPNRTEGACACRVSSLTQSPPSSWICNSRWTRSASSFQGNQTLPGLSTKTWNGWYERYADGCTSHEGNTQGW